MTDPKDKPWVCSYCGHPNSKHVTWVAHFDENRLKPTLQPCEVYGCICTKHMEEKEVEGDGAHG